MQQTFRKALIGKQIGMSPYSRLLKPNAVVRIEPIFLAFRKH